MNSQRSTYDQLLELMDVANRSGLYGAADYLARHMPDEPTEPLYDTSPIHNWFSLTYASYLVVPRVILQSMSVRLQWRFVACLNEMNGLFGHHVQHAAYTVQVRDRQGKFVKDDLADYQRGRRTLEPKNSPVNKLEE